MTDDKDMSDLFLSGEEAFAAYEKISNAIEDMTNIEIVHGIALVIKTMDTVFLMESGYKEKPDYSLTMEAVNIIRESFKIDMEFLDKTKFH